MSDKSDIQWTDATWNPVRGCTRLSPGCGGGTPGPNKGGCYAEGIAARFSGPGKPFHGFAEMKNGVARWTGKLALIEDKVEEPRRWKKPRRIFVNSMSDLFHENLPDTAIDMVFAVMALCPQHTFQVLTKRAERMRDYWARPPHRFHAIECQIEVLLQGVDVPSFSGRETPLHNVWLGVSVEDQQRCDERVPMLLNTPASVRFISAEPLLERVTFFRYIDPLVVRPALLDWIIVGGESGRGARPFDISWAEGIRNECRLGKVACFIKQLGAKPRGYDAKPLLLKDGHGGDMSEWPQYLRVREFPMVA